MNQFIQSIKITTLAELLSKMEESELWVEWRVRCEIGPDWIGGGRSIQFYLGDFPLSETPFHTRLKSMLIQQLAIPEESADAVIYGEGGIRRVRNRLEIEYEWYESVPFMSARNRGDGTEKLIDLGSTTLK